MFIFARNDGGGVVAACRVAIQSFGAPQCGFSGKVLCFFQYLESDAGLSIVMLGHFSHLNS